MTNAANEFGVIGLGRMGGNLARQALTKHIRVVGYDRDKIDADLLEAGLVPARSLDEFAAQLTGPKAVLMYVPAGPAIDAVIEAISPVLQSGDVLVDGGNSYWGDSIRRHAQLSARGIHFVDLGTSGGVEGALHGACFMAGGELAGVARVEPILRQLSAPGGFVHAGPAGAGHFTKLVHNGIEFGMLEAIGEGIDLLERFGEKLQVRDILRAWQHGSVIRCWLIELLERAYNETGGLDAIPGYVEDTGEVNWLVEDALHMEVPIPVIAESTMQLLLSRDNRRNWARAIAMMRHEFGGHPYGPDAHVAAGRQNGRVGDFTQPQEPPGDPHPGNSS